MLLLAACPFMGLALPPSSSVPHRLVPDWDPACCHSGFCAALLCAVPQSRGVLQPSSVAARLSRRVALWDMLVTRAAPSQSVRHGHKAGVCRSLHVISRSGFVGLAYPCTISGVVLAWPLLGVRGNITIDALGQM